MKKLVRKRKKLVSTNFFISGDLKKLVCKLKKLVSTSFFNLHTNFFLFCNKNRLFRGGKEQICDILFGVATLHSILFQVNLSDSLKAMQHLKIGCVCCFS